MIHGADIVRARKRISSVQGAVVQTPLQLSLPLSRQTGVHVYLKCEHLQNTGSFKLRGALNKLVKLTESPRRSNQIVAASSGNHGLAVALSARLLGFDAEVFVPASASPMKIDAIQGLGAKVTKIEGEPLLAETEARKKAELENLPLISPYNDLDVIAGQGTIGIELMEQLAELDAVVIAVGGGGLISGIGTFLKEQNPSIEIIGAWPKVARSLHACLEAGEIISIGEELTLSDGTAGGVEEGAVTFPIAQRVIDKTVLVSESEIACAMKDIGMHERWIIEGAAGVAVAGLGQLASEYQNKNVAVVLCGRNITLEKYLKAINEYVDLD